MTDATAAPPPPARTRTADALLDGAIAGGVGAIVIILWFVALDLAERRDPATFAWVPVSVIERLVQLTTGILTPAEAAVAGALLLLPACAMLAALVAWALTRMRRTPTVGMTLTAMFAALLIAFFALDGATGGGLFTRLRPWSVLTVTALAAGAMTLVLLKRQPRLIEGRRELWDDEP
jgi:hypothetical protein